MEEKVFELEKRLEKLERKEQRRKILLFVKIGIVVFIISIFVYSGYRFHKKIENTIKPIKEIIEKKRMLIRK